MCFWSENHQVIFAVAEYLAGQRWPGEVFTNPGPGGQALTGADRMRRAGERLRTWMSHRFRFGFTEWLSNTYYEEDAAPLALLIDLAADPELAVQATIVLDLLVLDMSLHRFEGWFVGSAGRSYELQKKDPRDADTVELADHAFGVPREHWDLSRMSGLFVTSSYATPEVLRRIAAFESETLIRESFGLDVAEVGAPGELDPTGIFYWLMEAFTTPESIRPTMAMFRAWRLHDNRFLKPLAAFSRVPSRLLPPLVRVLNPATKGVAIQRADVTTFRTPHGLLSSAQSHQPGGFGDQQHIWQATLPGGVNVFATHPAAPMFDEAARNFSPSAWVGNGINPHVGQDRGVLLAVHDLRVRRGYLERRRLRYTHLYWPAERFNEEISGNHAGGGTWLAARAGASYIGVVSPEPLAAGLEPAERVQRGDVTGWVVVLGDADTDGTFEQWCEQIRAVEVALEGVGGFGTRPLLNHRRWSKKPLRGRRHRPTPEDPAPATGTQQPQPTDIPAPSTTNDQHHPLTEDRVVAARNEQRRVEIHTHPKSRSSRPAAISVRVRGALYELDFARRFTRNGKRIPDRHPRFDTPFVSAERFPNQLRIEHGGHVLELDWGRALRRTGTVDGVARPAPDPPVPTPLEVAVALCDDVVEQSINQPVMPWMWGPALFGNSLALLDNHLGTTRYREFLLRFADHHLENPPRIDYSDHVAPALITWQLQRDGFDRFAPLTERAVDYIRTAPRPVDDAVNHLGASRWNWIYPRSIWVDSLMMFSVFPAMFGRAEGIADLVDAAARQPRLYAHRLFDGNRNLWHHSYWVRTGRPYPNVFWGRGNGWVVAALPMILDELPLDHVERPVILDLLERTSRALLDLQRADGTWPTVLADNRRRPSRQGYRELSATALVASGWLHAVSAGHLPDEFRHPAERALAAVASSVRRHHGRLVLPDVSGPTIPVPVFPRLGYLLTPTGLNHTWGVAAFVMAAINGDRIS